MTDIQAAARRLLAPWDRPGSPGATLGLVRDGTLVLQESAGLASLELDVPIGEATAFRIASVSKQFTCAAILLLAAEGKLSVDDDIHRHLPALPDVGAPISLDQLMHNCSGLRDMLDLMRLSGAGLSHPATPAQLMAAIGRQRRLNFPPGTRFLYSNTGFLLLGQVVEAVAGEPLGAVLERRILAPLGMTRTRHTPTVTEVVPGLATGYLPRPGGGFLRAAHGFPLGGEGGLVSCIADLARWDANFTTGAVGGTALGAALTAALPFADGTPNRYRRGLEAGSYRGIATFDHGGLWPGFKTCFLRAPETGLTAIAIANHGGIDAHHLAHQLLDAALAGRPGLHPVPPMPAGMVDVIQDRWLAPDDGTTVEFGRDATGGPTATQHGVSFALEAVAPDRLAARRGSFPFALGPPRDGWLTIETDAGVTTAFRRPAADPVLPGGLAGRYACAELETTWNLAAAVTGLAVEVRGPVASAGPWPVEPIEGDLIRIHIPAAVLPGWVDVRVLRTASAGIAGLLVNGGRARGLRFDRMPGPA